MLNRCLIIGIVLTCSIAIAQSQSASSSPSWDSKLKARQQLNRGVESYRAQKFDAAIEHFKNAVALDPGLLDAKLYLATSYANLYAPCGDGSDYARLAIARYKDVLAADPQNITALRGIASLLFYMKKFDEAREYYQRAIKTDPSDPENYYSLGVRLDRDVLEPHGDSSQAGPQADCIAPQQ